MSNLIEKTYSYSPASEAYRMLRTNLQFSSISREVKVIAVTSPAPGEGKSTTVCNYALSLSKSGKKVMIIDCDLRKPKVHMKFKISNFTGLTNVLLEECSVDQALSVVDENLEVLTSGTIPPNPAEILGSNRMKDFLAKTKLQYDLIILDTPPILVVTDGQVLSSIADGVLLVVESRKTTRDSVLKAKGQLMNVNANILGIVLNKCDIGNRKSYDYYYTYSSKKKKPCGK